MTQRSLFWDGTTTGDCGPYRAQDLHDRFLRSITGCTGDHGVLKGWLGELEVTSGGALFVNVAPGAAVVYGTFYEMDVSTTWTISPTAIDRRRYDRLVLRRDRSLQTVRLTLIQGEETDVVPLAPELSRDPNLHYDIPLALILVEGSAVSVTDERHFAAFSTFWPPDSLTSAAFAERSITEREMADAERWQFAGAGQIRPDANNPATWNSGLAGPEFDGWSFSATAINEVWLYFLAPTLLVPTTIDFYLWTTPHAAESGAVRWEANAYCGWMSTVLENLTSAVVISQTGRSNNVAYCDLLLEVDTLQIQEGMIIAFQVRRNGTHEDDTFPNPVVLLGLEMRYESYA